MESERIEAIEACRTCGIFYMTSSNYLKHLFQSPVEQPEMMLIRLELSQWKVEVAENDGFPQYVCSTCIHEFQKVFKFRTACMETQEQFKYFCNLREENRANIKIKTERVDPDEDKPVCDFIYVDDLSEAEYDGATPFNIPHVPIKEELIEAATIPMEVSMQAVNTVESASKVVAPPEQSVPNIPLMKTSQNESVETNTERPTVEHIECKLCQHVSYCNEDHKLHLQRVHEIRDMECHVCGKEFKNSTTARIKFHMKWHTLNKHVKCTLCGFVCSSKDALREHKRANHSRVKCKICGKGILTKKIKSHLRNHELLNKYTCDYCAEAFSTEDQRENHIWELHANESNNPPTDIAHIEMNDGMLCQGSEVNLIHYKFLCAHCEERFIEQVDLETHVKETHRTKTQLLQNELQLQQPIIHNSTTNKKCEDLSDTAKQIAVFEDYDNDEDGILSEHEHYANESDLLKESFQERQEQNQFTEAPHIIQTTFNSENAVSKMREDVTELCNEPRQFQNDTDSSSVESGESSNETQSEAETQRLEANDSGDLKPFACAKCAETFISIEQLRQHHELHLAASIEEQQTTSNKLKFKCNLCGKSFDLKFSLNRHVKKHKHAPV